MTKKKPRPMEVLVPAEHVVDYNVEARVRADGSGVETAGVNTSVNPFDRPAVEEVVRLKEKGSPRGWSRSPGVWRSARRRSASCV